MKRKNPTCSSWGHTCDPTSASTKTCIKTQEQQKSNMITLCMFLTSLVFIVDASSSSSDSLNKVSSRLQVPVITLTVPFASICVMLCNKNSFCMQFMLSYVSGGCGLLFIKIFYALASNAKFTLRSPFAKQLTLLFIVTFAVGRSPLR